MNSSPQPSQTTVKATAKRISQATVDAFIREGKPIAGRSVGGGVTFTLSAAGAVRGTLRYRFAGRARELTLGSFDKIADAKKAAREQRVQIDKGVDPGTERRKNKMALAQAKTFADLAQDYIARAVPDLAPASQAEVLRYIRRDLLPRLGHFRIDEVSGADIVRLVEQIAPRSDSAARRAFQVTRILYEHATAKHMAKNNPAAGLKLKAIIGKAKPIREKIALTKDEIREFLAALPAVGLRSHLMLRILLHTATRKSELQLAKRSDVDLDGATWTIPAENTKNRKRFVVPLTPPVVELFRQLIALSGSSDFIIPGRDPHQPASANILNLALEKIERARPFTVHDLRRTCRSHLGALGVEVVTAERCLNHEVGGLVSIYDVGDRLPQRRAALEMWSSFLEHAEQGRPWNVVNLRSAA